METGSSFCPDCGEPVRAEPGGQERDSAAAQTEILSRPRPGAPRPATSPFARQPQPSEAAPAVSSPDRPEHGSSAGSAPETANERQAARPRWVASPSSSPPPEAVDPASTSQGPGATRLENTRSHHPDRSSGRSFGDLTGSWPVEALGAGVVVCLALIKTMPALVVSLTDFGDYPKGAVVTLLLLSSLAAAFLTGVLAVRVVTLRRAGEPTPQTLALVAGAAIFVTTYGLIVTLIAALSDQGSALILLF